MQLNIYKGCLFILIGVGLSFCGYLFAAQKYDSALDAFTDPTILMVLTLPFVPSFVFSFFVKRTEKKLVKLYAKIREDVKAIEAKEAAAAEAAAAAKKTKRA